MTERTSGATTLRRDVNRLTQESVNNDRKMKEIIEDNDRRLKETLDNHDAMLQAKLKELERIVVTQGEATYKLKEEAKESIKQVADYLEQRTAAAGPGAQDRPPASADLAALELRLTAYQSRTDDSLKKLEGLIQQAREEMGQAAKEGTPALEQLKARISGQVAELSNNV